MGTATLTPLERAGTLENLDRIEDLEARVRAYLTLEEVAAPDLIPVLRRGRRGAELALAELLEDVAP